MGSLLKQPAGYVLLISILVLLVLVTYIPATAQEGDDIEIYELGANIYSENCAACHGDDGQGRIGATLAKDWSSIRPDLRIRETIERGIQGTVMPAWGQSRGGPLNDQEIDAVTLYILSWESSGPRYIYPLPTANSRLVLTPPPGVTGDPNRGAQLFTLNCALCHGAEGEGRIGGNLNKDWPSLRPDLLVKSVIENGVEGSVMPAWSQANGGPLSDEDINDIVAFILTKSGAETTPEIEGPSIGPLTGWPVWVIFIGTFILIIIAIVYYSRRRPSED
ncbi:MAG: c-type cytochrome [Anaerolineales bacterium]